MSRSGFEKRDFDRLRSPEQLDQLLTVTTPRAWLALAAAAFIIAATAAWAFGGKVSQTVPGACVLVRSGGVRQVVFAHSGQVTDIRPIPGDFVRRGDVVARLARPHLVEQILQVEQQLAELETAAVSASPTDAARIDDMNRLRTVLQQLREQLDVESRVVSPYDGRVVQLRSDVFEFVTQGSTLLTLELAGDQFAELEAVIYLPVAAGQSVHTGMPVQLVPASVRKEEYGYMIGRVVSVSDFPATEEQMLRVVGNEQLVRMLSGGTAAIEVRAALTLDPSTYSGFRWSSSEGPPIKLTPGTLCTAEVVIGQRSPASLLFGANDER